MQLSQKKTIVNEDLYNNKSGVVDHTCNPSIWKVNAGRLPRVPSQLRLCSDETGKGGGENNR